MQQRLSEMEAGRRVGRDGESRFQLGNRLVEPARVAQCDPAQEMPARLARRERDRIAVRDLGLPMHVLRLVGHAELTPRGGKRLALGLRGGHAIEARARGHERVAHRGLHRGEIVGRQRDRMRRLRCAGRQRRRRERRGEHDPDRRHRGCTRWPAPSRNVVYARSGGGAKVSTAPPGQCTTIASSAVLEPRPASTLGSCAER